MEVYYGWVPGIANTVVCNVFLLEYAAVLLTICFRIILGSYTFPHENRNSVVVKRWQYVNFATVFVLYFLQSKWQTESLER